MDKSKVYLCRCENLTLERLHELMDNGVTSMEELKRHSRATKGPCQGRTCKELIAKEMAKYLHCSVDEIDIPKERMPIKPILIGDIERGE